MIKMKEVMALSILYIPPLVYKNKGLGNKLPLPVYFL